MEVSIISGSFSMTCTWKPTSTCYKVCYKTQFQQDIKSNKKTCTGREPCSRIGLSLSLICQWTSEDIKQHNRTVQEEKFQTLLGIKPRTRFLTHYDSQRHVSRSLNHHRGLSFLFKPPPLWRLPFNALWKSRLQATGGAHVLSVCAQQVSRHSSEFNFTYLWRGWEKWVSVFSAECRLEMFVLSA